jgi:hypothetical protein
MFDDVSVDTGIGMKREIELIKYGVVSGVHQWPLHLPTIRCQ